MNTHPVNPDSPASGILPPPALGAGTLIDTADGHVPVDWLAAGDMVMTRDNGYRPLAWIGMLNPDRDGASRFEISAGALDERSPNHTTIVSGNQQILRKSPELELYFGEREVLVTADQMDLAAELGPSDPTKIEPSYCLLFDSHELIRANGLWIGSMMTTTIDTSYLMPRSARLLKEIRAELPDNLTAARMCLRHHEALILRHNDGRPVRRVRFAA